MNDPHKNRLVCISFSYRTTPVELRESLSQSPEQIENALRQYPLGSGAFADIRELVVISTCNRLEFYALIHEAAPAVGANPSDSPLLRYLRDALKMSVAQVESCAQFLDASNATRHLFEVAAGLDSIAIGETQILGQVNRALETAARLGCARHVLSSLFRAAIHTGKRVHSETQIGRHPTSISSVAVQWAADKLGELANLPILVVGAGKMGSLTLDALKEHGAQSVVLTNRSLQRAASLAADLGATVLPYAELHSGLREADLAFTTTSALAPLITPALAAEVMAQRPNRPLILVDLAVPRNVDRRVARIAGVQVVDMDDLQAYVQQAAVSSHEEITAAMAIIAEETAEFDKLLQISPFLGELHKKAEAIRLREVKRTLDHLPDRDPQVKEQIEVFSRALVRKILHEPSMHLRAEQNQATLNRYVNILTELFDLDETDYPPTSKEDEP